MPKHPPPASAADDGSSDDWWGSLSRAEQDRLCEFEQNYRREHRDLLYFDHRLTRARRRQFSNHKLKDNHDE